MIKDRIFWQAWEDQTVFSQPPDFQRNLRLLDAMYEHARSLGHFAPSDPLASLEVKIRLARALNVSTPPGTHSPRS
jgi:hypothetical protein